MPHEFWRGKAERRSKWDVAIIVMVAVLGVGWLLVNLRPIEYGDPVTHWERINGLLAGDALNVRFHHDARFALDVPALLVRLLFGDHPNLYYVTPLAAFAVLVGTTYRLGSRVFDRRVGAVAAILLIVFPESLRSGTQLLPGGFEATFVMLSAYFALTSKDPRGLKRPVLAAVFLFLGYMAKVQVLLYAPGLVIAIWLISRSRRGVVAFTSLLASLGALEYLVYIVAPWDMPSRLATLTDAVRKWLPELKTPFDLFDRYTTLPAYWGLAFLVATIGASLAWRSLDSHRRAFLCVPGSFVIVMTFGISSLHPLKPLIHFEARFLTSVIPFLLLFLVFLVFLAGDVSRRAIGDKSKVLAIIAMLAVAFLPLIWLVWRMDPVAVASRSTSGRHPLALNSQTYSAISDALHNDRTIAVRYELEEGSVEEIKGNAKRLRYLAVFFMPIESDYRAACFVGDDVQLMALAPSSAFDGVPEGLPSRMAAAGQVVLINSELDYPWWLYDVSQTDLGDVHGSGLLGSVGEGMRTISVRDAGDQHVTGSICPGTD